MTDMSNRRPLKTRNYEWPHRLAHFFVARGMTPNQMSLLSVAFATSGALAYWASSTEIGFLRGVFLFVAAACIQLRLLSNMLDGLMAVEGGRKTPIGILYNEVPDRIADTLFLASAGYACGWPMLGWLASVLAVMTAYIRALGGTLGFEQDFRGPMAKPHRMFVLTVGTLLAAFVQHAPLLALTLIVIVLGAAWTSARRTLGLAQKLEKQPHD